MPERNTFHTHDTYIGIWLDQMNYKPLHDKLLAHLRVRGFKLHTPKEILKHFRCLKDMHKEGRKGNLVCEVEYFGIHHKIEFWQEINTVNKAGGKYDFHKFNLMPYLVKKQFLAERKYILDLLKAEGYTDSTKLRPILAFDMIMQHRKELEDFQGKGFYDGPRASYNAKDRDGNLLSDGQIKYFRNHQGYLMKGTVYHNINNMWWVWLNKYSYTNVASFYLFDCRPSQVPRKLHPRSEQRMRQLMDKSVKEMDFEQAIIFRDLLKSKAA